MLFFILHFKSYLSISLEKTMKNVDFSLNHLFHHVDTLIDQKSDIQLNVLRKSMRKCRSLRKWLRHR
jgi:hypothetical protein